MRLLVVWVVTGLMTVTGALAYSELAAMMPTAGGQYVFLREGLNPLAGFLFGWTLFTVIQTGTIAAVAVAFGKFLSVLVPAVTPDVFLSLGHLPMVGGPVELGLSSQRIVALLVVLALTLINARGVTLGATVQTIFAVAKVGALGDHRPAGPDLPPSRRRRRRQFWLVLGHGVVVPCGAASHGRRDGRIALFGGCLEQRHLRGRRGAGA